MREKYDYKEAVMNDVEAYIFEQEITIGQIIEDREQLEEDLSDELWFTDSVTGNASGSYTFSRWQAEENLCHNWDLLVDACNEFDEEPDFAKGAEHFDSAIRCYLLDECIHEVLDHIEADLSDPADEAGIELDMNDTIVSFYRRLEEEETNAMMKGEL